MLKSIKTNKKEPSYKNLSPQTTLDFGAYPEIYICCGDLDSCVPGSESLKWIQAIREQSIVSPRLVNVKLNRGHELYECEEEALQSIANETGFIISAYA